MYVSEKNLIRMHLIKEVKKKNNLNFTSYLILFNKPELI